MNIETLAIHAGQAVDPQTGAVMTPIYQTSTFAQKNPGQDPYMYSRAGNPTRKALEECLAALEGAKHGLAFASGMSATDAALRLLLPGDHVVTSAMSMAAPFASLLRSISLMGLPSRLSILAM